MPKLTLLKPARRPVASMLREAKVQFMRLQTAYDSKNLNDLREFTTPEVYAEIQMQLQERGNAVNHTDVVSLNSELLEAITEQQATVASVRFSGMVKEDSIHTPTAFNEVWHFKKESDYARWVVAGIQQN
jgi:predicted lipid-binding transport protein (Tim44 family)